MSNLPKGWEEIKLGEILNIQTGKKNAQDSKENGEYPFFTRSIDTQKIDTYSFDTEALFIAGEGNFTVKYYKGKFDLHQRTYMLTALKENTVDLKFLQNNIQPKVYQLVATSVGSTVQSLRKPIIEALKIPLPPLEEQKKIADILSTVDKKIAFVEENIKATEELKKGLMQKLLTEGIGHTEFKDSELGRIPESWEVESLDNFSDITKLAGFEFTEYFDYEAGGDIIAIRALNVVNGKLVLNNLQRISSEISNKLLRSKLYVNDILFTYVGTLGQVAMIEENDKYHLAPNVAKITIENQDKVISKFLLFYLISNFGQKQIKLLSTTTSQPAINMGNIRKIKLPVPQIEEQKQIAEILSTVDNKLENLKEKKLFFQELKKGLMQKLLTGEVRI